MYRTAAEEADIAFSLYVDGLTHGAHDLPVSDHATPSVVQSMLLCIRPLTIHPSSLSTHSLRDMEHDQSNKRERLRKVRSGAARALRIFLEAGAGIPAFGEGITAPIIKIMDECEVRTVQYDLNPLTNVFVYRNRLN